MATSYKKTSLVNALTFGESSTKTQCWDNLDHPITKKEFGNITHIEFSPVVPYNFAATSSSQIHIYSSRSNELIRGLNRFTQAASSGSYRSDGKLLVAGDHDGKVRLFDPSNRSLLRVFNGHTEPVLVTKFMADNNHIMSASKDKTVRIWDIPTEKETKIYKEFKDYVKCGVTSVSHPDIFLTGAYDHTAKLFDSRTDSSVLSVDHGFPVESVLMFPSDGIFMTAGGNVVKVWDSLAGGKQLSQLQHHHKTVMSLCFCNNHRRFMSGSSDRHIKIYDVATYQMVHSLDYPANILSVAVAPDDSVLAVGMEGGLLSIQHQKKNADKTRDRKRKAPFHYQYSPHDFKPQEDDMVVSTKKKEKMDRFDKLLKHFEHSRALDAALEPHVRQNAQKTMGVIMELKRRGMLKAAIAGRDAQQLQPLMKFMQKNIWKPHFSHLLDVLNIVIDLYGDEAATSPALQTSFARVREVLNIEHQYQVELSNIKGMLDTFFASYQGCEPV